MSPGDGSITGAQPSCTTVSLGKYVRGALRAATGKKKKKKPNNNKRKKPGGNNKGEEAPAAGEMSVSSSMELTSSFSGTTAARKESVVRVVLRSGVVEVYPGVVLACAVIRKHPPGLCLAHPDVFRNPHGAVVRPLEPLFPGQKFLLIPETTVVRLKQKIPESSIGAFLDDDDDDDDDDDEEEDQLQDQDYISSSSGAAAASSSEEDEVGDDDDGGFGVSGYSAREFYVANDRCCQFNKQLVDRRGEQSPPPVHQRPERNGKKAKKIKGNKKKKKRKDRRVAAPMGFRSLATTMRTWEPSLPSVEEEEEEEACCSPQSTPVTTPHQRPRFRRSA